MPNTSLNTNISSIAVKNNKMVNYGRWIMIGALLIINALLLIIPQAETIIRPLSAMLIALFAFIHGYKRYGLKNMAIFFLITWIVSNTFESLSIAMGFPFGNYHYTMPGPRLVNVPLLIMPAYFGMGYISLILSNILNGQYSKKLRGIQIFFVPFIASFIMVMWDVVMDPSASTVSKRWIWEDGGNYFGVPISNYLGWFFVVYIFMQIFAIFISKFDNHTNVNTDDKSFWLEAVAVYGIQGLTYITPALVKSTNLEIYSSTGLVCVFTMIFVAILSAFNIINYKDFSKGHSANAL